MSIVMELEPQYPLIWLWSRKVERRWVVIWSWLDGKRFRCSCCCGALFL
ncbi:BnaCnng17690D [Brassica napus]|uniref:BnaCnng17690D protein n=1 Tax=Brassica napus TaxID=3708 RepID=A0A078II45_BRANA|nr:BnaCnng17690D [Brassica napus]